MRAADESLSPAPMPYHRAIAAHLQATEPGLWHWFASSRKRLEEADAARFDLLKPTYRLDSKAQPQVYDPAHEVPPRIGVACINTLHQAQTGTAPDAALG